MSRENKTISVYFYFVLNFRKIHLRLLNYHMIHLLFFTHNVLFSMLQNHLSNFYFVIEYLHVHGY
jgi:hypothetical protein